VTPLPIDLRPDEAAVRRMWTSIDDRLPPRRARWPLALALAGAAALAAVVAWPSPPRRSTPFPDGSAIAVDDARLELLEDGPQQRTFHLHEGRARFSAGGRRRWVIEAGTARIEAIATAFEVWRTGDVLAIRVERGDLMVRSPDLPDGIRRLGAGESLTLGEKAVEPAPAPSIDRPPPPPPPKPPARKHISVERLLADADDLRRAGRLAEAVEVLGRVARSPSDPLAGMAWFTRARLLLDLGRDAEAATDLERAIDAGLPPALEQRARARLEEL
jgi:transmembrane sensor